MFVDNITIGRTQGEPKTALKQRVWEFAFIERSHRTIELKLVSYVEQTRETPRKKWKTDRGYSAYDKRRYFAPDNIELPEDVIADARKVFVEYAEQIPVTM